MKKKKTVKAVKSEKITPFLWFNNQAEEAAKFYVSVFGKNSKILKVVRYGKAGPGPEGTVMIVSFQLAGQRFTALNGGPQFTFSLATSFVVDCATQKEIDWFWEKLSAGGEKSQCGWLKDKYGLSWQVVPAVVPKFMSDPDPMKSQRVMNAVLKMGKIEIEALKKAYRGSK
jgi:predicted 3-demethylubiquinone-9 3-methyltransferase (glyoxalase superfamily)